MLRISGCILFVVALIGIVGTARPARAQDEAEAEDEQGARQRREPVLTHLQLEQFVYGHVGADRARLHLESRLAWEIQSIDEITDLTPAQKRKLEVAGRGDIKRRFDRVREGMARFDPGPVNQLEFRRILLELEPLRAECTTNPFGDGSMFAKTLTRTLTLEQRARQEKAFRNSSYQSRVHWVVFPLDRQLRLSKEQHRRFVAVIVEETRPLKRYGELDDAAVMWQASRLPAAKLKPIFDDDQWRMLGERFVRAKMLEKTLIAQGYLDMKEPAETQSSARKKDENRKPANVRVGVEAAPRRGQPVQD